MIERFLLYFRTISYLKPKQIIYQLYYKLKSTRTLTAYENRGTRLKYRPLRFSLQIKSAESLKEDLTFNFLNLTHRFEGSTQWDFMELGKLWNYNLQYFNYLHQDQLSHQLKLKLLNDIGEWLKDGRLQLEPYPVSLRVMNSIRFFATHGIENEELLSQTLAQLNYLSSHPEYHIMGNHLLENAFALFMGGHAFGITSCQVKAKNLLYQELEEQILNDGSHFELSPMYHQIILFRLLELIEWYSEFPDPDQEFLNFVKQKAALMMGWLQTVTFKNGDIPHFNDSTIDIAFSSPELFSFGRQLNIVAPTAHSLKESGYRKFTNNQYECVVDCGSIAAQYQPGHSHADIFSFVLYLNGDPFIVDTGTSTYEKNARRNYERSTCAHNTVEIDNKNQFEIWNGFRVGRRANVHILKESGNLISASHDGYKITCNATHERDFNFDSGTIRITDIIHSPGSTSAKAYLHFHPDCMIEYRNGSLIVNNFARIILTNATDTKLETYEYPLGYNVYKDAKVLVAEFKDKLETAILLNDSSE